MFPRARIAWLSLLPLLAASFGSTARAEDPPDLNRPEAARRLVKKWDFEERKIHVEPVPVGWFRGQDLPPARAREGFPKWNEAELSVETAASGEYSIKLPTRGGSTSLVLSSAVVPAIPEADYAVFARVRTTGLKNARARMSAWLLDRDLKIIDVSRSNGPLVESPDAWSVTNLVLTGQPTAAWIQIELNLLQPEAYDAGGHSPQEVRPQDFDGAAYFDDLTIMQTPRVEVRAASPSNIIVAPEKPGLKVLMRDLTGEPLTVDQLVYNIDGTLVSRTPLQTTSSGQVVSIPLDLKRYGWYRTVLVVSNRDGPVAQRHTDLLYLPPQVGNGQATGGRFGIVADRTPVGQLPEIPTIARRCGAEAVSLPVWREDETGLDSAESMALIASVTDRLIDEGREVTFVLNQAPEDAARSVRGESNEPLAVIASAPEELWMPHLGPLLSSFGERVRRWQLGSATAMPAFLGAHEAEQVDAARKRMRRLVPRPIVTLPWSALEPIGNAIGADALNVSVPWSISADSMGEMIKTWPESVETTAVIELPPPDLFGRRATVIELVKRAVLAWTTGPRMLSIRQPFAWRDGRDAQTVPEVSLAVWRTLATELSGRKVVGELAITDGARVFIAQGKSDSVLIAWNDSADPERAVIRGYLGESNVRVIDPFGNTEESSGPGNSVNIPIPETPIFIEGVDAQLARFRAGMRIEPGFLPARAERHHVEVVIENPWPIAVQGRLHISDPKTWTISPRTNAFSIAPESSARVPIDLAFGLAEETGVQQVTAEVELSADRRYPLLRLPLKLEIGLAAVQFQPSYRVERPRPGAPGNVVVTLLITNQGDKPVTLEAFAQAPGYPAFSAPISSLEPGTSAVRRFLLDGGAERLNGKNIRVGLKELDGTGRINKTLTVK
ncbi:MAG TPA: hypothetical protein VG797_08215 [Phycisphaerales bacterium]|nr:hypothetical protein [Phycisphaerales bacterium]